MIEVVLYSRADCHLCEQARIDLESLQNEYPHLLKIVDVDSDAKLRKEFGFEVPVVETGPYRIKAPFTRQDLQITLGAAQHRANQIEAIDKSVKEGGLAVQATWTGSDRFSYWLSRHWLAVFNILIFIYVGLPFVAPVLMKAGATRPAGWIYRGYSFVCHQLAYRSWFLFGEQPAYPREIAGVEGLIPYGQATGQSENDLWTARLYEGNEIIGYKVALCERDIAIYVGILLFGLVYAVFRRKFKSLHWAVWLVLAIFPIGLDGVSQLLSQPPLAILPYRESTPLLRSITGFLFGFLTAWFGYPLVQESMDDTLGYMEKKLAVRREAIKDSASMESKEPD
jgi:uncharacterized membrane protein